MKNRNFVKSILFISSLFCFSTLLNTSILINRVKNHIYGINKNKTKLIKKYKNNNNIALASTFISGSNVSGLIGYTNDNNNITIISNGTSGITGKDIIFKDDFKIEGLDHCHIVSIGEEAFYKNSEFKGSIDLSKCTKLTAINNSAFNSCHFIKEIKFPSSLETIGDSAFFNCQNINFLDLSNCINLLTIDKHSFSTCIHLTFIDFSNCTSLTSIENHAFSDCSELTSIDLKSCSSLTAINNNAFFGCTNLASLFFPSSLTNISSYSIYDCKNISFIQFNWNESEIPNTGISSEWLMYSHVSDKSKVNICIPDGTYDAYNSKKEDLGIDGCNIRTIQNNSASSWIISQVAPSGILEYWNDSLSAKILGINSLSAIDPSIRSYISIDGKKYEVKQIDDNLFNGQEWLVNKLIIKDGITSIGAKAFYNCKRLTSLDLSSSIMSIGVNAFNLTNINTINLNWNEDNNPLTNPSWNSIWLGDLNNSNTKIHIPSDQYNWYVSNKDILGINNCTIINPNPVSPESKNLTLILGLSLGLGIPVLTGTITGTVIGIEKHKGKKTNKKKIKK